MKAYLLAPFFLLATIALGQDSHRIKYSINESWIFFKDAAEVPVALSEIGERDVEIVDLPHTWNAEEQRCL